MVKHKLHPDYKNKIMAKIVISDLHPIDVNPFIHDLVSEQIEDLLGGDINVQIIAINYGFNPLINIIEGPYSVYDNRTDGTDYSRQLAVGSLFNDS
ncbi:hypothetical protein FNW02_11000 [Komarekiella sp. 'clone 1']|uniref:Uncharacterized protein n=1 Tax=Komarekiella delphini-convector SJRDD-AB1 TaxID=2593771 RepID=A0AA40VR10_9NOST|nr:hypothetical protein [Komarekiella delphini-convector]MBD6616352.1 hypothetical protein [Komarekiella delphini-convector SJRDD-AB1]